MCCLKKLSDWKSLPQCLQLYLVVEFSEVVALVVVAGVAVEPLHDAWHGPWLGSCELQVELQVDAKEGKTWLLVSGRILSSGSCT